MKAPIRIGFEIDPMAMGVKNSLSQSGVSRVIGALWNGLNKIHEIELIPICIQYDYYSYALQWLTDSRQFTAPIIDRFYYRTHIRTLLSSCTHYHSTFFPIPTWLSSLLRAESLHISHTIYDAYPIVNLEFTTPELKDIVASKLSEIEPDQTCFAISQFTKSQLIRLRPDLRPENIRTAYPSIALDLDRQPKTNGDYGDQSDPYFLAVSTLEPRKNFFSILKAYSLFRRMVLSRQQEHLENKIPKLVLVGSKGWLSRAEVDSLESLPSGIEIKGFVSDEELVQLLYGCLSYIVASHGEGFGLPPLEALACGSPVISSAGGSLPEVLADQATYYDGQSITALAEVMVAAYKNQHTGTIQSRKQRAAEFSIEGLIRPYVDYFLSHSLR